MRPYSAFVSVCVYPYIFSQIYPYICTYVFFVVFCFRVLLFSCFWWWCWVAAMQTEALPLVNKFQLTEDLESVWVSYLSVFYLFMNMFFNLQEHSLGREEHKFELLLLWPTKLLNALVFFLQEKGKNKKQKAKSIIFLWFYSQGSSLLFIGFFCWLNKLALLAQSVHWLGFCDVDVCSKALFSLFCKAIFGFLKVDQKRIDLFSRFQKLLVIAYWFLALFSFL